MKLLKPYHKLFKYITDLITDPSFNRNIIFKIQNICGMPIAIFILLINFFDTI